MENKFDMGDEVYFFDPDFEKGEEIFQGVITGVRGHRINANSIFYTYYLSSKKSLGDEIEEEFLFSDKPLKQLKENIISRTNQRIFFIRQDIKELNDKLAIKKDYLAIEKQKIINLK